MMEVSIKTKLIPFHVPNYVLVEEKSRPREDGFKEVRKFHLSELDDYTLASLCNQFREDVFRKARKPYGE